MGISNVRGDGDDALIWDNVDFKWSQNATFVALIMQKVGWRMFKNIRPISLLEVPYKLLD